jgi:hypothetical protein
MRMTLAVAVLSEMTLVRAMLIGASMLVPTAASTQETTANDLLPACRDFANGRYAKDPFSQGECVGIIRGLAYAAPLLPFEPTRACPPDGITVGQMTTVVVRWLEQRPQEWHRWFYSLVVQALHDTWPCSK